MFQLSKLWKTNKTLEMYVVPVCNYSQNYIFHFISRIKHFCHSRNICWLVLLVVAAVLMKCDELWHFNRLETNLYHCCHVSCHSIICLGLFTMAMKTISCNVQSYLFIVWKLLFNFVKLLRVATRRIWVRNPVSNVLLYSGLEVGACDFLIICPAVSRLLHHNQLDSGTGT